MRSWSSSSSTFTLIGRSLPSRWRLRRPAAPCDADAVDPAEGYAADARARMVDRLRERDITPQTLDAFARVPRHLLVPRFWIGGGREGPVEHRPEAGEP